MILTLEELWQEGVEITLKTKNINQVPKEIEESVVPYFVHEYPLNFKKLSPDMNWTPLNLWIQIFEWPKCFTYKLNYIVKERGEKKSFHDKIYL